MSLMPLHFTKMHGLGNDFVLIEDFDGRWSGSSTVYDHVRWLADRRQGVGADQVIFLVRPQDPSRAAARMVIVNADGSPASACGNGARCVAWYLVHAKGAPSVVRIEAGERCLQADVHASMTVSVEMGEARVLWDSLPEGGHHPRPCSPVASDPLAMPVAVDVGNQHLVFFVEDQGSFDAAALALEHWAPAWERWAFLPRPSNISLAWRQDPGTILLRVWEIGAGATPACGSAACATFAAAVHRGMLRPNTPHAIVQQPGGSLTLALNATTRTLTMTGAVALSYHGTIPPEVWQAYGTFAR